MIFDFVKFYFYNSFTQLALHIIPFGVLFALVDFQNAETILRVSALVAVGCFGIALLQNILLFFNKKLMAYKDLTKLLLVTKKIEAELESYGAGGKGMFEKAKSIEPYLKEGMLDEILLIADVRNKAMHGNPYIENANEILQKARKLHRQLRSMSALSYKIKSFTANAMMYMLLYLLAKWVYENYHLGGAFLSFVFGYMINKVVMNSFGYGGYILSVLLGFAAFAAFVFNRDHNFTLILEFVRHVF